MKYYRDKSFRDAFYIGWIISLAFIYYFFISPQNIPNSIKIQHLCNVIIPLYYIIFMRVINGGYVINKGKKKFGLNSNIGIRLFTIGIFMIIGSIIGTYNKGFSNIILGITLSIVILIFSFFVITLLSKISEKRAERQL